MVYAHAFYEYCTATDRLTGARTKSCRRERLNPSCTSRHWYERWTFSAGRSAVKTEVYSSSGVAPLSNFDSKLKFRGLLVDESQLPAAVFSELAFTVRSLAFTD